MIEKQEVRPSMAAEEGIKMKPSVEHSSNLKVNQALSPKYSNKVTDIDTEFLKMKASLKEMESELERRRISESKLTKQLEESKIEIASLKEKLEGSIQSQESSEDDSSVHESDIESLKMELESTKESLVRTEEEMKLIKNELKLALEAEITSKKAMDDLAMALTEVASDCTKAKEKLMITEEQMEAERLEGKQWKEKLEVTEENYKTLLQEMKKEAEIHKNTSERLRIEAEESLLAWNGKESVFVNCIKRGEDEKNSLIDENNRLLQALMNAENLNKKAKDENHNLRDILKQAINEANVAKVAAGIARAENSQLKDTLMDKEEELQFALQEVECLRLKEISGNETVKNLKRLLSEAEGTVVMSRQNSSEKESNNKISRQNSSEKEINNKISRQNSIQKDQEQVKEHQKEKKDKKENHKAQQNSKRMGKTCSFSLRDLKISSHKHKDAINEGSKASINNTNDNTDVESDENSPGSDSDLFKGSIFDVPETPHNSKTHNHTRKSNSTSMEDGELMNSEDSEGSHYEEGENEKGGRKKKAFIRRFGDLLVRRKSFSLKKDSSGDLQEKQQQLPLTPPPTPPELQSPEH